MCRSLCLAALLLLTLTATADAAAGPWIGVRGNHLVDGGGRPVRLLGVNRSSADYECVETGERVFAGATDWDSIRAMKRWGINAVRVPLNETCWLGINGVPENVSGPAYRAVVREYVDGLERAGFYVILDLHWAAPGEHWGTGLIPLPDADHTPDFWASVASEYRSDRSVLFDLFNEPHDVSWECWSGPCTTWDGWFGFYQSVGLPRLLEVVRGVGARQPVLLGGLDWARDLRGWAAHRPYDPAHALVAANHTYDYKPCYRECKQVLARIARKVPVVTAELGEVDCRRHYVNPYMRWADRAGISYLAWSWNAGPGWACEEGPALIKDFDGTPTTFGVGLLRHLKQLGPAGG